MKNSLDTVAKILAKKLKSIMEKKRATWEVLVPIEQQVTAYGKSIESRTWARHTNEFGKYELSAKETWMLDDYPSRLYTSPLKQHTVLEYIALKGSVNGVVNITIRAENEVNSRVLFSGTIRGENKHFFSAKLNVMEFQAGDSLTAEISALTDSTIEDFAWVGASSNASKNNGARVVLIRTYGNRLIVEENLQRLAEYLRKRRLNLDNYLFVIYDATTETKQIHIDPLLKNVCIRGGNFGGGGNASLLQALVFKAADLCPSVKIDEVIIWDDDAILEPQIFLRHDGFVLFRRRDIAHTGIVLSKSSPNRVQEYGGLWGSFFDRNTGQISLENSTKRQLYPYLVRYNRDLTGEWEKKYIGTQQEIDFGTFIYISVPFELLEKIGGTIPFFLRNDDVELGFRIKKYSASIVCNQNFYVWHEATHNVAGEFYATLHGFIVNSVYCDLDLGWLVKEVMGRCVGAYSVRNSALLDAYLQALRLFRAGPSWLEESDAFSSYLNVSAILSRRLLNYIQVPQEVVDQLSKDNQVAIYNLTNSRIQHTDGNKIPVFHDLPSKRYLPPTQGEADNSEELLSDISVELGLLASSFEDTRTQWVKFVTKFDAQQFWSTYYSHRDKQLALLKPRDYARSDSTFSLLECLPTGLSRDIASIESAIGSDLRHRRTVKELAQETLLPADFDPSNYLKLNPDVANAKMDPVKHYLSHGINENRRYR